MPRLLVVGFLALLPLAAAPGHDEPPAGPAPLFANLGKFHHAVTTSSKEAQAYFDQGFLLLYAFNHPEAIRSFEEAARRDPACAMAWWGVSYAYGSNINMPMMDEAVPKADAALRKAQELAAKASEREQAYIQALAKRYSDQPVKDRKPFDRAYAEAMAEVWKRYPDDLDAATLFAEALMDTMPWDYWTAEGKPRPDTVRVIEALEAVLRRAPDHPGANHYYIHALEASPAPERALGAAYRLRDLVPGSGHLVHMPSHIFLRVGYYHEASLCNERAVAVDDAYIAQYRVKTLYTQMYAPHNAHFLAYTTAMEGRSADAVRAARKAAAAIPIEAARRMNHLHWIRSAPVLYLERLGRWDQVLREPQPPSDAAFELAMWHYARGRAHLARNRPPDAALELANLKAVADSPELEKLQTFDLPGASLVRIAHAVLQAETAGAAGKTDDRLTGLAQAVRMQDELPYTEPPFWHFPVRQLQGRALAQAGRYAEAEKVYREDLRRHPENGWSLFGLLECHRAQGKPAAAIEKRFRDAWSHADLVLTGSSF